MRNVFLMAPRDDAVRRSGFLFDVVVCLLLVVAVMKLLGILGTAVDTEYVHFDVTLTCLIASLRASQRGWLWVFWVAIAFFTLYFPVFVPYFAPNVWQRIDVASAILMLVGAYAWLIVGWRERRKAQTAS